MMPDSVPDMPLSLFPAIASKISTLSDADISLLADDAMACLIDAESSRFLKEEKDLLSRPSYSDEDERKLKEQKLLIGLNSHLQNPTTFLPNSQTGSHQNVDGKVPKATDRKHGSQVVSGPTTPLPDKKLLLFILDRLQKKDTHGVFSELVDPEELPDYHDIIKDPVDFGTTRKKLDGDGGLHISPEQFENEVFLVCSNAMQYYSPDTIYHQQAPAMQEIARKDSAEFFPFFAFAKSVISHLFPRKAKDKEEEEITHTSPEDTSHPVTLDGIIVLTLAVISCSVIITKIFRNFSQWLDIRLKYLKGDFTVTTITPQPQEELIPSHDPIYSSKYSRTADVQGLKGIRYIQKAKTVFLYTGQLQILSYQMIMLNLSKTKLLLRFELAQFWFFE
ncbi:hypothetical protein P8452_45335 [Trifolium repens]|nr:hypothetical protein P8452_45335 [Trifolium repens]